jgi:hypothetical protein
MAKRKETLKNFLETNPVALYFSSIVVISGVIFSIAHFIFRNKQEVYEEKLKLEYQRKMDLLDEERSRIVVKIGNEKETFDFNEVFIEGSELPTKYKKLEGSPFALPQCYTESNWSWKKTNFAQILADIEPDVQPEPQLVQLLSTTIVHAFEKNEVFEMKIRNRRIHLRPRITFEFTSRKQFSEQISGMEDVTKGGKIPFWENEDGSPLIVDTSKNSLRKVEDNEVTYFNVFFNLFTSQKDSRMTDYLGEFIISDYYFNKDVFLINGYYNIAKATNNKLEKFYCLQLGLKRKEGVYLINFNMPVSNNYQEVRLLNTLVHGLKIIK